jgi:predicted MFS family arabinose efflux permease
LLLTAAMPDKPGKTLLIWGSIVGYVAALGPLFYSTLLGEGNWQLGFALFALLPFLALMAIHWAHTTPHSQAPSHSPTPPNYKALLSAPGLWLIFVYIFSTYGAFTYFLFKLPTLMTAQGFSLTQMGLVLSGLWISFSLTSTLLRNWVDAPHLKTIVLLAPVLMALAFPLAFFLPTAWGFGLAVLLMGSGLACSNSPSTQLVLALAPKGTAGLSTSLDITFARLGGALTVGLLATSLPLSAMTLTTSLSMLALGAAWGALHLRDQRTA